ncbi:23S rRNA (uracil(1939)-C(5))-methyltransferase RlmD [uncultured Ruminococcus sp.]|uniref:23S rRNA (uracil(1939)-C(5))-methyltransferase RlmD n=1 Tax=uncultured Ruminococcus sp. TaxID=165186 RepID=UPI0029311CEF|nr:23S rRNA (uracil(1939)-C(5))-methyltransferase RlmD [uncultured Ruminococcus sp.]
MYRKNEIIELNITSLTSDGDGVGRAGELVFFVPNTAVGDIIRARVLKVKKNVGFARVEEVLTPSSDRIEPDCPVSRSCGGCVYRHISYDAELSAKRQKVIDAVTRIGKLPADLVKNIIPSEKIDGYRNKAMIPVGLDRAGEVVMGFYARHSHNIMHCLRCQLSPEIFNAIAGDFYTFLRHRPQLIYTPQNRRGIRHLYLRYAESTGDVMVCVVAGDRHFEDDTLLYDSLTEKYDCIKSIVVNVNPDDTNVILGKRSYTVYGDDSIADTLCGLRFEIAPAAFYQVNRSQAERLYGKAKDYAALTGSETLLDLYCGAGTIGMSMADRCKELIGVEIIPEAIENAKQNAARNGVRNARFLCGDATKAAETLRAEGIRPDVIVVDPPRKGLTPELIDTIVQMSPDRVVYVSCDPATLARDLKLFSEKDYSVKEITPCDMFPRTAHVESVAYLKTDH